MVIVLTDIGTGMFGRAAGGLLLGLIGLLWFSQNGGWILIAAKCIYSLLFLLLVILGIVLALGKGARLIPRFKDMPEEEQQLFDKPAYCRFLGKIILALGLFWIPISSYIWFKLLYLLILGVLLFISTVIFAWLYVNSKHRFKKK
jgi:MFS family permease